MTSAFDRRNVLKVGAGLGGLLVGTAARPARAQEAVKLTMAVWGGKAEVDAYNAVIAKYQAAHPNVSVRLDVVPFGNFYQQLDTRLAGKQAPLRRLGTANEVAHLIVYLASRQADFITGQSFAIDGGQSLWGQLWQIPDDVPRFVPED